MDPKDAGALIVGIPTKIINKLKRRNVEIR